MSTLRAPPTRVLRINVLHHNSLSVGLVLHEVNELTMRPLVEHLHRRRTLPDMTQVLKRDVLAVVHQRFFDDIVGHAMQHIPNVPGLPAAHLLNGAVCGLRTSLLEITANPLELSVSMSEFPTGRKVRRTGGGDGDDTEVNAENCPVLAVFLLFDPFRGFRLSEAEVEVVVAITPRKRGFGELPVLVVEVLVLVAVFVVRQREIAPDAVVDRGERETVPSSNSVIVRVSYFTVLAVNSGQEVS